MPVTLFQCPIPMASYYCLFDCYYQQTMGGFLSTFAFVEKGIDSREGPWDSFMSYPWRQMLYSRIIATISHVIEITLLEITRFIGKTHKLPQSALLPKTKVPTTDKSLMDQKQGASLQIHFWIPIAFGRSRKEICSCNTQTFRPCKLVTHRGNNEALNYFISSKNSR